MIPVTLITLSDGPHADPSMVRPAGPNQMVNRMQSPAGTSLISVNYIIIKACCVYFAMPFVEGNEKCSIKLSNSVVSL